MDIGGLGSRCAVPSLTSLHERQPGLLQLFARSSPLSEQLRSTSATAVREAALASPEACSGMSFCALGGLQEHKRALHGEP